jgi:hypothetical protein
MTKARDLKVGQKFAIRDVGTVEVSSVHLHHGFGTVKLHYKRDDGVVMSMTIDENIKIQVL